MCKDMQQQRDEPPRRYRIGDAARAAQVCRATIRAWDAKGLFSCRRDGNGRRIFTADDLRRLRAVAGLPEEPDVS